MPNLFPTIGAVSSPYIQQQAAEWKQRRDTPYDNSDLTPVPDRYIDLFNTWHVGKSAEADLEQFPPDATDMNAQQQKVELLRAAVQGRQAAEQIQRMREDKIFTDAGDRYKAEIVSQQLQAERDQQIVQGLQTGKLIIGNEEDVRKLNENNSAIARIRNSTVLDALQKQNTIARIEQQNVEIRRAAREPNPEEVGSSPETKKKALLSVFPEDQRDVLGPYIVSSPDGGFQFMRGAPDSVELLERAAHDKETSIEMFSGRRHWTEYPNDPERTKREKDRAEVERNILRYQTKDGQELFFTKRRTRLGTTELDFINTGQKQAKPVTFAESGKYGSDVLQTLQNAARSRYLGETTTDKDGKPVLLTDAEIDAKPEVAARQQEMFQVAQEYADAKAGGREEPEVLTKARAALLQIAAGKADPTQWDIRETQRELNQIANVVEKYAVRQSDRQLVEWVRAKSRPRPVQAAEREQRTAPPQAPSTAPTSRTRTTTSGEGTTPSARMQLPGFTSPFMPPPGFETGAVQQSPTPPPSPDVPRGLSPEFVNRMIAAALGGSASAQAALDKRGIKWRK